MRRWNGWGDEATTYPLPESAGRFLEMKVGKGRIIPDVTFERALVAVPPSRLIPYTRLSLDPADRLYHARGQSLSDWIALRHGRVEAFPDGVAYPVSDEEVRNLFAYAKRTGTKLIPFGGGTSVVGHINPRPIDSPTLTVDLSRLNHLIDLDTISHLATFEAGVCGPDLERQLKGRGYTLGHFPQSWEWSTLGGWIATRSSGQQSYHYGRIEDLFAGGHTETPQGPIDLLTLPASAAGPDLRHFLLGSEGRYGIITRAIVRVQRRPASEDFHANFFHDWSSGAIAVREIVQDGIPVSMLRLSNAPETEVTLALSGKDQLVGLADRGLRLLKYDEDRALLIFGVTGDKTLTRFALHEATTIARKHGGFAAGTAIGHMWQEPVLIALPAQYAMGNRATRLIPSRQRCRGARSNRPPWQFRQPSARPCRLMTNARWSLRTCRTFMPMAQAYTTYLWRRSPIPIERWRNGAR
jgi:alkyldihydroxyacetonephosphate synthase